MMKIRYALLLSVSCLGLGSIAHAGLIPDIIPVGKNTSIFTQRGTPAGESPLLVVPGIEKALGLSHPPVDEQGFSRSSYTHLASQSKLLSASVIARRTSSDKAIHNNINGSPRGLSSARDDNLDDFLSTQHKELKASRLLLPEQDTADLPLTASVCFITDAGNCRGDEYDYGGANTPDNSSGGTPGGSSSGGDNGNGDEPEWELNNKERCNKEGYVTTKCNSVENPVNYCPYDNTYFEKCVCKPDLVTCEKPYYGVGESCGGKYASCELDNPRACREDGYVNVCPDGQKLHKDNRCPYDNSYGICCTEQCINNSSTTCTGAAVGGDGCGYLCYKCCDDTCPAGTSKTYKGAYSYTTGCGNKCYKCSCPNGTSPNYHGVAAGEAECGTCYKCDNTCTKGTLSSSCASKYNAVRVGQTECGNACYECRYNSDCDARSVSCTGAYQCQYNSCGICSSCYYNADCEVSSKYCKYGCRRYNNCSKCVECKECLRSSSDDPYREVACVDDYPADYKKTVIITDGCTGATRTEYRSAFDCNLKSGTISHYQCCEYR